MSVRAGHELAPARGASRTSRQAAVSASVHGPQADRHASRTDWSDVVAALDALGAASARVGHAGGRAERERLQELASGLAALARGISDESAAAAEDPGMPTAVADRGGRAAGHEVEQSAPANPESGRLASASAIDDGGVPVSEELRPHILEALRAVNERLGDRELWDLTSPSRRPSPAPLDAGCPAASGTSDGVGAVRAARERFAAERRAVERAVASRRAAAETSPTPVPAAVGNEVVDGIGSGGPERIGSPADPAPSRGKWT